MNRILAVDDAPETLIILQRSLRQLGHEVDACPDPEEALRLLSSKIFDLVFLDIMMPKIDGLEICRRIRSGGINQHTKIVIFSAKSDRELVEIARKYGADFYLCKPAKVAKIQEIAKQMIG